MRYIEAPTDYVAKPNDGYSIFLAGGITGCPDWQTAVVSMLRMTPLTLFNPRRKDFPIHDPAAAEKQIRWEFDHLRRSDAVLFWFPKDTLCPIVLFELGAWSKNVDDAIYVGTEEGYPRTQDVQLQLKFARPDVEVVHSLTDLADQVKKDWLS